VHYGGHRFRVAQGRLGQKHFDCPYRRARAQAVAAVPADRRRPARLACAEDLPIKSAQRHIADVVKQAKADGVEWVFIDTPPNMSASVTDAIGTATLVVIPCRPGVFDLDAVKQTIECAREARKPYAVIINAAPPKRQDVESPTVTHAREILGALQIPVWGGQITQRANFSAALAEGEGAKEYDSGSTAAAEIARLWVAIEKSVKAIHGAREGGMHRVAA
jgi:chromosome partitioning protein